MRLKFPKYRDTRTKAGFLFWPKNINGDWRWWEFCFWEEIYIGPYNGWIAERWADDN